MPILYMDETNFNLFISRTCGRSRKGSRCSTVAAGSRGANVHLIGCISSLGMIYNELRRGSFKQETAREFVRQCLRRAYQRYQCAVVLIVDNAPCHTNVESVFLEDEFSHNYLLRLGPYSPMFNPIEEAWSCLKAEVKADLARQLPAILGGNGQGVLTKTEFRLQQLEGIIMNNLPSITVEKCARFVAHVQRAIPDALNMEDVNF